MTLLLAAMAEAVVYVVDGRDVTNRGGCWLVKRRAAFTTTMATTDLNAYTKNLLGANLTSLNYFTIVGVAVSRDSLYTLGLDSLGVFPDSAVSGTGWTGADTTCLYLDGFVDELLDVVFFIDGTVRCTLFATVEQAFRYDESLADSGFNYGFFVTDTLFFSQVTYDYDADLTNESIDVAAVSADGAQSRIYRDSFLLIAPCLRLKIISSGLPNNAALPGIMIELYARHNNTLMGGTSGRLIEQIPQKAIR